MNIHKLDYNPETDAVEVFVTGCTLECHGCHNGRLWDFQAGSPWEDFKGQIANTTAPRVMVMGGEPLDQDHTDLCAMLDYLREYFGEIWLFTGHEWCYPSVASRVDWMKFGRYIEGTPSVEWEGHIQVTLASDNQFIIKGDRSCK